MEMLRSGKKKVSDWIWDWLVARADPEIVLNEKISQLPWLKSNLTFLALSHTYPIIIIIIIIIIGGAVLSP
jgi:hypothetical protein